MRLTVYTDYALRLLMYLAVKDDLARVRAVGVRSTGEGEDTTSEIRFQIP